MTERLTKEQAAIIDAYTGFLCGPFSDMHDYIERIMGRSVWTHELGIGKTADDIREKAKADFLSICAEG